MIMIIIIIIIIVVIMWFQKGNSLNWRETNGLIIGNDDRGM
jgi:hypothetical protein